MGAGRCQYCRADVIWAMTVNGKRMPIDPEPREDGNAGTYRDHLGRVRVRVLKKGEQLETYERPAMPHKATCRAEKEEQRAPAGVGAGRAPGNVVSMSDWRRKRRAV